MIVSEQDFIKQPYSIAALNPDTRDSFQNVIRLEMQYYWVKRFLGDTLGQAFIDDLDGNFEPQSPEFITIFNDLTFEHCGVTYHFEGIKKNLVKVFYYEWTSLQNTIQLHSGNSAVESIAAMRQPFTQAVNAYNSMVRDNDLLCMYIYQNHDDYPDYEHQLINLMTDL